MANKGQVLPRRSLADRFWEKVEKAGPDDCWLWKGAVDRYGHFFISHKPYRNETAHRVSWKLAGGEIPEGMVVDHMCRNTLCVNPKHLRIVTPRINGTENNASPMAINAQKTHCAKCGTPYEGANLALYTPPRRFTRHGHPATPKPTRICLTCFPTYWRWAVIPRDPPPGAKPWREPRRKDSLPARSNGEKA